jgi:hypothetical protein
MEKQKVQFRFILLNFVLARLPRDIAKYFISLGKELSLINNLQSLKDAKQYYLWSREL